MPKASSRLARLLALVPYLISHPGIGMAEAAEVFGVSAKDIEDDLQLLVLCGLPGYGPGDLVEIVYEGEAITVRQAETIARPLRMTPDEALALVVAARTLAAEPGLAERDALDRALVKLEAACAPGLADVGVVAVQLEPEGETLPLVEKALADKRRLHLRYLGAGRDEVTERDVDPMRVINLDGRWYLEGYCRKVEDVRLFRLDRMLEVHTLDVAAEVPAGTAGRDLDDGLFRPSPDDPRVVLELGQGARWVADYYPSEALEEIGNGGLRVTLRVRGDAWLHRLLLRLGGQARVVEPASLAAAVRERAAAALANYGG